MKKILLSLLITGVFTSLAWTQVAFKYQGVARNAQNAVIVNQNIALKLSILNAANTVVYSETHLTKTSDLGIINVNVCQGANATGTCASIDWAATGGYQLKVELDAAGGSNFVNLGNSPILQVPVASYATKAGSVPNDNDGNPLNEIQSLTFNKANNELSISQGNKVDITPGKFDPDSTNEIQKISLDTTNNEVILSKGGGSFLLPASGASLWKKVGNELVYNHTTGTGLTFNQGKFAVNFAPTTVKQFTSGTQSWAEEFFAKPTNTGNPAKTVAYGGEIIEYPVTLNRHFLRFNADTNWRTTTFNYLFTPPNSSGYRTQTESFSQARNNNNMPVRVISNQIDAYGGIGNYHAFIGGGIASTAGALTINNVLTPFIGIWNAAGSGIFGLFFNDAGRTQLNANIKNFVEDHPTDPTKQIWYASLEGPEAGAYDRGTATLINGEAEIKFAEHFELTINPTTVTIQLTPSSAESEGLAVVEKTATGFKVKELRKGKGNYSFDWEAKAVRKGYEDYQPVRDRMKVSLPTEAVNMDQKYPFGNKKTK